ncbi:MAG: hypothetical protein L6R42_004780 [Xanthoria sp. 1 TBL-2021]|nr:MAG: hypothetical protein L6R42_004780 [Xanthoria sp. 1 TBL-2021]
MTSSKTPRRAGTGRQHSARPKTRNLIRWTDELDKKLLLTIQWACNVKGIKIPFELVASEMSSTKSSDISAGAIVQHLAKFRVRMVEQGLSVPPPLTRGGNNHVAAAKASQGSKTDGSVKAGSTLRSTKPTGKKSKQNDDSEQETPEETDDDSEIVTPKKPSAKAKGKRKANGPSRGGRTSQGIQQFDDSDSDVVKQEPTSSAEDRDSQARYGVGDSMWNLDGTEEAPPKRVRTSVSSSQSSQSPTKVIVLDIGREGFAKLGVSGQAEDFEPGEDVSGYQSENSEHSSNDNFHGNSSPMDRTSYGGAAVSATTANYHNPYGHNTFGSNQTKTLEDEHDLGLVQHDGFEEDLLGHVTLYDQNRSNGPSGFNDLSPASYSYSHAKSHGNQKHAAHNLRESSDLAGVDERLSSNASTANPKNGVANCGRLSEKTAMHNRFQGTSGTYFYDGVTGVSNRQTADKTPVQDFSQFGPPTSSAGGHRSSYSSMGSYQPIGGDFVSFPEISYGDCSEKPSGMSRNPNGLDYMASGAPFHHDDGTTWEAFLDSENYGFGY